MRGRAARERGRAFGSTSRGRAEGHTRLGTRECAKEGQGQALLFLPPGSGPPTPTAKEGQGQAPPTPTTSRGRAEGHTRRPGPRLWATHCGSHTVDHTLWVTHCGSHTAARPPPLPLPADPPHMHTHIRTRTRTHAPTRTHTHARTDAQTGLDHTLLVAEGDPPQRERERGRV